MNTEYFLFVQNIEGDYLHYQESYASLEQVLQFISPLYLSNPPNLERRNAWATVTDGKLARLYITRGSAGILNLTSTIDKIDILTEEHLHKIATHNDAKPGRTQHEAPGQAAAQGKIPRDGS